MLIGDLPEGVGKVSLTYLSKTLINSVIENLLLLCAECVGACVWSHPRVMAYCEGEPIKDKQVDDYLLSPTFFALTASFLFYA